jgi:hypothetical protein
VNVNGSSLPHQLFQVIELTKAKSVDSLCLLVYNVDKATNTMVDGWCVLVYAICKSRNNLPEILIVTQVITSLASAIPSNNAGAHV